MLEDILDWNGKVRTTGIPVSSEKKGKNVIKKCDKLLKFRWGNSPFSMNFEHKFFNSFQSKFITKNGINFKFSELSTRANWLFVKIS